MRWCIRDCDVVAARTDIKRELKNIRREIKTLNGRKQEEAMMLEKSYPSNASGLLEIVKYMMNENKKTTMILKNISDTMERMEDTLIDITDVDSPRQMELQDDQRSAGARELPVSDLDAKIIQVLQMHDLACADDVRAQMDYKGRNAASARLNRLYRMGIIERHQLGRKVYYRYDAGKATNTLIVSPHSKQGPQ